MYVFIYQLLKYYLRNGFYSKNLIFPALSIGDKKIVDKLIVYKINNLLQKF